MSLQNLGKAKIALDVITDTGDDLDDLLMLGELPEVISEAIDGMDLDKALEAFIRLGVSGDELRDVLKACGFELDKVDDAIKLLGKSGTKSTSKLSSAFKGLWQIMKAHPIASITTAVVALGAIGYQVYKKYQEYIQECVDAAKEASTAWSENRESLEAQIKTIEELRTSLDSGTLSEAEAYQAKSNLLTIQQDLTDSYGKWANGIDLVNGDLQKQIELLESLTVAEANEMLSSHENVKGFEKAEKEMTKDRTYYLGVTYEPIANDSKALNEILEKYDDNVSVIDSGDGITKTVYFKGDAEDADEVLTNLVTDLRNILIPRVTIFSMSKFFSWI